MARRSRALGSSLLKICLSYEQQPRANETPPAQSLWPTIGKTTLN
jgi:hypothetical protein